MVKWKHRDEVSQKSNPNLALSAGADVHATFPLSLKPDFAVDA